MERITKDGAIKTDETMSPRYVWYKCSVYNLPDNTLGGVGYHVVYRPLCKPDYKGTEVVTDQMMADTREHYRLAAEMEKADEAAAEAKASKDCDEMDKIDRQRKANGLCPHCHTYCDGDCQQAQAALGWQAKSAPFYSRMACSMREASRLEGEEK